MMDRPHASAPPSGPDTAGTPDGSTTDRTGAHTTGGVAEVGQSTTQQDREVTGAGGAGDGDFEEGRIAGAHDVYEKGEVTSIGALVADITTDLSTLMRQEMELAKAEVRASATHAARGAGMMGGAGVAAHFAVLFLTIALWWAIGTGIHSRAWAGVIVALLWAITAAVLAAMGRRNLKEVQGVPRTVETAKKVPEALKGNEDTA